jgi:glycosyltransferase involved in cell wall biosynthesis
MSGEDTRPIKVLSIVSYQVLPAKVGGQKGIALFYKYLSRYLSLTCVATKKNDVKAAEGYEMLNILSDSPFRYINLFYFFKLRKLIKQRNYTHLLLEHPYLGWLAVLLKRATGIKLIVHSHNIEGLRWKTLGKSWWKILWYYEKWVHRNADYNFFKQNDDKSYAEKHFSLQPERCHIVTYGIEWTKPPSENERNSARQQLLQLHSIPPGHTLLLFNGAFDYLPNLNGLKRILGTINPQLQQRKDFDYTILICGRDIPQDLINTSYPNVIFAGFVNDISVYFKGASVFLNPIIEGGGIKTKLVEALGSDMNAVSSTNGAIGVDPAICNGKMKITNDSLEGSAEAIIEMAQVKATIPAVYFDHFYWGNIAQKAAEFISG